MGGLKVYIFIAQRFLIPLFLFAKIKMQQILYLRDFAGFVISLDFLSHNVNGFTV